MEAFQNITHHWLRAELRASIFVLSFKGSKGTGFIQAFQNITHQYVDETKAVLAYYFPGVNARGRGVGRDLGPQFSVLGCGLSAEKPAVHYDGFGREQ